MGNACLRCDTTDHRDITLLNVPSDGVKHASESPKYVRALTIRKKMWTPDDDYTVKSQDGEDLFKVHGKCFRITDNISIRDASTGKLLCVLYGIILSVRTEYIVLLPPNLGRRPGSQLAQRS